MNKKIRELTEQSGFFPVPDETTNLRNGEVVMCKERKRATEKDSKGRCGRLP